ncbi:hypothetical protein A5630_07300 [Mycolicibacterium mucogenicum]|uniref:Uncharacterized protein n=1 Tax=Mycolicibacterium mucogenicum TaxID=56689 RepID=A0A1A3GLJ7_MYCMU|nr:hypothetical protein A5630_07300 [Mycolicibacterium mucogenicum]
MFVIATYLQDSNGWQLPTKTASSITERRAAVERIDDIDLGSIGNMTTPLRASRTAPNARTMLQEFVFG